MPESTGFTGRGVTLEISDGNSPSVYISMANVRTIGLTGRDAEEIDFTHLGSEGGFREFRQGFKDAGTVTFEFHYTPTETSHVELLNSWLSGEVVDFRINYSGAGRPYAEYGHGFIRNPGDVQVNVNDPVTGSGTLRITGGTQVLPA